MTYLARGEGARLDSELGIRADGSQLSSNIQSDLLVTGCRLGCGILVLCDGSDLGVHGSLVAENGLQTDGASVALKSTVQNGLGLAINITSCLSVGEGLVNFFTSANHTGT